MQYNLFQDEQAITKQRKLLDELIHLKTKEIRDQHFNNFFGTQEAISKRHVEADEKIQRFISKVSKAFPDLF